jgi:hypothetical protein
MVSPAAIPVLVASGYPQRLGIATQFVVPEDAGFEAGAVVVGELELAFVVLLVGIALELTAVTVGVLDVGTTDGVVLVEVVLEELVPVLGVTDCVALVEARGVVVAEVGDPAPEVKVRSTQYWLACQLLLGNELADP